MNLVEQVARMLDSEGAYGVFHDGVGESAAQIPFTTRQKYFQAKYECLAIELLKLIGGCTRASIKEDLIAWEMQGWRNRGVPVDDPALAEIVSAKYT